MSPRERAARFSGPFDAGSHAGSAKRLIAHLAGPFSPEWAVAPFSANKRRSSRILRQACAWIGSEHAQLSENASSALADGQRRGRRRGVDGAGLRLSVQSLGALKAAARAASGSLDFGFAGLQSLQTKGSVSLALVWEDASYEGRKRPKSAERTAVQPDTGRSGMIGVWSSHCGRGPRLRQPVTP
jgi:hypothetical protein